MHGTQCGTLRSNIEVIPSAHYDMLGPPCPVMESLPDGASNIAQCNLVLISHQSSPSDSENFSIVSQSQVGTLMSLLCALALHRYQHQGPCNFFYYEYAHPLHPTAQQTLVYKGHVPVAT
ncbi:hypothetical protein EV424DRAFT_1649293, partial [Suillus variegatus]